MGQSAMSWLEKRNISLKDAGIESDVDLQQAPLFAVIEEADLTGDFVPVSYTHLTLPTTPYV